MEKNPVLTTQELSKYLKLNEKTILKMAQAGELPGVKIANQWRFYLSAVDEYLQDKIAKSSNYDFSKLVSANSILPLSRLVEGDHITMDLKSGTRDDVLRELAHISQNAGLTDSAETIFTQLMKREKMLSTGVGNGVAIPHPRNPSDDFFCRTGIIMARSVKGIDFYSLDDKKVHLFFMVCATDVVLHLKLLSKIAKLLEGRGILSKFMEAGTKEEMMRILLKNERMELTA